MKSSNVFSPPSTLQTLYIEMYERKEEKRCWKSLYKSYLNDSIQTQSCHVQVVMLIPFKDLQVNRPRSGWTQHTLKLFVHFRKGSIFSTSSNHLPWWSYRHKKGIFSPAYFRQTHSTTVDLSTPHTTGAMGGILLSISSWDLWWVVTEMFIWFFDLQFFSENEKNALKKST